MDRPALFRFHFIVCLLASLCSNGFAWPQTQPDAAPQESPAEEADYDTDLGPQVVSSGSNDPRFACYDVAMSRFMKEFQIPGASLAVTYQGRVVFAKGYGYAVVSTKEQVTPDSLFRIASVSKPVTAIAILQLVQNGKLRLDDLVLDHLGLESEIHAAGSDFDGRWKDITVRHLLQHRGGWDRKQSFDAMFRSVDFAQKQGVPSPADAATVISVMMGQPLDFDPGARFAYSNFGYCLLGRLIEKRTGMGYEEYVQDNVLKPLDIRRMRIGATRLQGRAPGEVQYYEPGTGRSVFESDLGQEVPWPYGGWYLEAMDSHGGWIASATDLAKIAMAFDDWDACPILARPQIQAMFSRPHWPAGLDDRGREKNRYYSLGWNNVQVANGKVNRWHTGSLSGTTTTMIRRHDERNFVALLNTRHSPKEQSVGSALDRLLHKMADAVEQWPRETEPQETEPQETEPSDSIGH